MNIIDRYLSELEIPTIIPTPEKIQRNIGLTTSVRKELRNKHFRCLKGCIKLLRMGASRTQFYECKEKCKYENYLDKANTISKKLNFSGGDRVKTLYKVLRGD